MTSSSTTYLDLSKGTYVGGDIRYESGGPNIGYVKDGQYVDFYVENETPSYYTLQANIPWYQGAGKFTVTITDVATSTEEATATSASITATSDATVVISNKITAGLKTLRISFAKDEGTSTTYLFNLKNITFYQRSLNEDYDYSPVAASNVDVELVRSIAAGKWATLVLPFAMTSTQRTEAFGANAKFAKLSSYDSSTSTLTFASVGSEENTVANQPYMVYLDNAFSTYTFTNVTVSTDNITESKPTQTAGDASFVGTYSPLSSLPTGSYFISNNQWMKAASGNTISMKGTRAYFTISGASSSRELKFVVEGETTGINVIGQSDNVQSDNWYDLQGRLIIKSSNRQMKKGLYIVNGKKVVVK